MSKFVRIKDTNGNIVLINLDEVKYATSFGSYIRIVFGSDVSVSTYMSLVDFQSLISCELQ